MDKGQFIEYLQLWAGEAGGQKQLSQKLNISEAYLSDIINGRRDPGDKLLSALKMERVVTYRFSENQ